MQYFGTRTWEWDTTGLPAANGTSNGRYFNVHLVAGDPWAYDSTYKINVENLVGLSGTPTPGQRWIEGWNGWVDVTDGRLTISNASGSVNNDQLRRYPVTQAGRVSRRRRYSKAPWQLLCERRGSV